MLSLRAQVIAAVLAGVFLIVVVDLVRRHRLQERYAWLWVGFGVVLFVGSLIRGAINSLGELVGVFQPAVALLSLLIFGVIVLVLHLTVVISRLSEQNCRLAQDLALLRAEQQLSARPETLASPELAAADEALDTD